MKNKFEQILYNSIKIHESYAIRQRKSYKSSISDPEILKKNIVVEMDYKAKYYYGNSKISIYMVVLNKRVGFKKIFVSTEYL